MTLQEVLAQVIDWLQHHKRLSYRALKRQFALDDAYLEDLKEAILFAHPQVVDEDGRGLVWSVRLSRVMVFQDGAQGLAHCYNLA